MSTALIKSLATLLLAAPLAVSAATVTFSYSGSFGAVSVSASGEMQIADLANANGSYDILGISGTRAVASDVQTIVGLATGGNFSFDNDLFLNPALNSGHYFTTFGLLYSTTSSTGPHTVNVFDNFNGAYGTPGGYGESSSPANPAFNPVVTPLALAIQRVPEPGSLPLLALALGAAGWLTRRSKIGA